jgi:N-methylhydantoinase B/oxoprolinase/acetone carboxylase alpha subunit
LASTRGVVGFCAGIGYPIQYVRKYFLDDVGLRPGDAWIFNDPFYGGLHSPDQAVFMPVFYRDRHVAWVSVGMHEGENGAKEPGGMGAGMESPYDEGIKLPPVRFAENYRIRPDFQNALQNQTRDPRLMGSDLKAKLVAAVMVEKRLMDLCRQYDESQVVAALRQSIEYVASEVRRRVRELPDGTVRTQVFLDSTMREDALIRFNCELSVVEDRIVIDFTGSAPEIANRPINGSIISSQVGILMGLLNFAWPDLPRQYAMLDCVELISPFKTVCNASHEVPTVLNMQVFFKGISLVHVAMTKLGFGAPRGYGVPIAPWFNQTVSFIYGGLTQNYEQVGNLCADLNGMSGGGKCNGDGEHSVAPSFAAKCDTGESELAEEGLPFVQLMSKRVVQDNCGFGKFRAGNGYEFSVANLFSDVWGFAAIGAGSKFPTQSGLFGGYGCGCYPVARIEGINVFDQLNEIESDISLVEVMNKRPFEGARYRTVRGSIPFEMVGKGELWMQSQGAGGGYGDVLDRDPQLVMKDLHERVISPETARDLFCVVYDSDRLLVDHEATEKSRARERARRLERARPFDEFVEEWKSDEPPAGIPYFGAWNDDLTLLWANGITGRADELPTITMPDPRDARIAALEAQVAELEKKMRRS